MLIRNIWAVGRNYAEHARELENEVPATPLIFLKAGSSATVNSNEIVIPKWCEEVHHEVELVLKVSQYMHVMECGLALDLTERKLQSLAKQKGEPWTMAKSFPEACPVSAFFGIKNWGQLENLTLKLWVNDKLRQEGNTDQMIFKPEFLFEYIKLHFPVCPSDLILTGTPKGVSALQRGDKVKAEISGLLSHTWVVK